MCTLIIATRRTLLLTVEVCHAGALLSAAVTGLENVGVVTRGTTNPNRLRRCDRWLCQVQGRLLRRASDPALVVDLGYGASPVTTRELHDRLQRVRPDVQVVGIEIDPARVERAASMTRPGLSFARGGFEVPTDHAPTIIRAFNVLRQYDEDEVAASWQRMTGRLAPGGIVVDGTCDELGRIASWVTVDRDGPRSLTISLHLGGLDDPGVVAQRLPKALIHHNVPGTGIHRFLNDLSGGWARAAGLSVHGARQRFVATAQAMRDAGWPVLDRRPRWRMGELTVRWDAVAPPGQIPGVTRNT